MRVKLFGSAWSKASIEVTYKVPVSEGICRGNKLQRDVTSKRTSGLFVFPTCQMLILAFCLLFQEGHAGRILMYLPVATRYAFSICFCVQTRNLSNVLPEQDSQWFTFYLTKMRKSWLENGGCFTHIFWTNCHFFLLEYKITPAVLWKAFLAWIRQIIQKGKKFTLILEIFTQGQNIFYTWLSWQIPRLLGSSLLSCRGHFCVSQLIIFLPSSHLSAWTPLAGSLAKHGHQVWSRICTISSLPI